MATVAIFTDSEMGHLLPTYRLARHLKTAGHRICYLGPVNVEEAVRGQQFEFIPIFNDALSNSLQDNAPAKKRIGDMAIDSYFSSLMRGDLLDSTMVELRPSVALVNYHNPLEGLAIRYRYRLPVIFYEPALMTYSRENETGYVIAQLMTQKSGLTEFFELLAEAGLRIGNFRDVARLMQPIPKLIFIPRAFDDSGEDKDPGVYYIGDGIEPARSEQSFQWDDIDPSRPIIYCARGSQLHLQMDANRRLFQVAVDAAAQRPEWQFIIAIGSVFKVGDFADAPPNVILCNWVPQLEVLSRSTVMVNHGGLGTIKECIYSGVPMVVLPLKGFRDQSYCAGRVAHHGIGVQTDNSRLSPAELVLLIEQVVSNPSFKDRIDQMREQLKNEDGIELAAKVVENAIAGSSSI